jgi:hypothetical protein
MTLFPINKLFPALLVAGIFISMPAKADTLIGTVLSTQEKQCIIKITTKGKQKTPDRKLRVVFNPVNIDHHPADHIFPRCVRVGKTVQLKGHLDEENNIFIAEQIKGWPGLGRHHHDPTGVRGRLGRCRHGRGKP